MILYLDTETTTKNTGHPFTPSNKIVSYAALFPDNPIVFEYYTNPGFSVIKEHLQQSSELCGFNIKFDLHHLRNLLGGIPCRPIWDCQLAEYVLSGQTVAFASLNETLASYGFPVKPDLVSQYWNDGVDTLDIPIDVLREYNIYDVECLPALRERQQALMTPAQIKLVYLMGRDLLTLADAEYNGVKFDFPKANERINELKEQVRELEEKLSAFLPTAPGFVFNFNSGDHLSCFLYGGTLDYEYAIPVEAVYKTGRNMGKPYTKNSWHQGKLVFPKRFVPLEGTEIKKTKDRPAEELHLYQTDAPTLKQLTSRRREDKDLLQTLLARSDKIKVVEMIQSILDKSKVMEWENDMIHGQFNQTVARTGRLSSSNPNLQNTPPEIDELFVSVYD